MKFYYKIAGYSEKGKVRYFGMFTFQDEHNYARLNTKIIHVTAMNDKQAIEKAKNMIKMKYYDILEVSELREDEIVTPSTKKVYVN